MRYGARTAEANKGPEGVEKQVGVMTRAMRWLTGRSSEDETGSVLVKAVEEQAAVVSETTARKPDGRKGRRRSKKAGRQNQDQIVNEVEIEEMCVFLCFFPMFFCVFPKRFYVSSHAGAFLTDCL